MNKKYLIPIAAILILLIAWLIIWKFHNTTEIPPEVNNSVAQSGEVLDTITETPVIKQQEKKQVESEILFDFIVENIPADVLPGQIRGGVFQIDSKLYAMAYEPNLNFPMARITIKDIKWHGVLQSSDKGASWKKFFTIKDESDTSGQVKYNPVGVFAENGQLYIDIVNDRGAGSGEGYLKRYGTKDDGKMFAMTGCFYFTPEEYYTNEGDLTPQPHNVPVSKDCGSTK
jgi:hypothetical protein